MSDRSRWFVPTEWLAGRLDDPDIVVIDGSWHLPGQGRDARAEYDKAHIPGAIFFDIDAVADTGNPLPHMLPTPEAFAAAAGALGIDERQRIVVYDSVGLSSAPRVWWTFRTMGATDVVLRFAGNITGLSTRLGADLYVLTADVVFPPDTELADVAELLQGRMSDLGVHASLTADDEELL